MSEYIYLDTETTGLNRFGEDEILELSIIDDTKQILFNKLLRPTKHTSWIQAENVHHISPEMVNNAPTYADVRDEIMTIFKDKDIVAYNVNYDKGFFDNELVDMAHSWNCAMLGFSDYINVRRWQKLEKAIAHIGYEFEGDAHRALSDTRAARVVWKYIHGEAF